MIDPSPNLNRLIQEALGAVQHGDFQRAYALADAGLRSGYNHPLLLKLRAANADGRGRPADAAADFRAALAQAPDDAAALNGLGLSLARLGQNAEALSALDEAIRLKPSFAAAHFNRGWVLERTGQLQAAERTYENALKEDGGHLGAKANLAILMARRADWARAATLGDQVLGVDPEHPVANIALAMVELAHDDAQSAETRIRALLGAQRLQGHERSIAVGLLGDCLDRQGRFGEAFEAYAVCNQALRSSYVSSGAVAIETGYDFVRRLQDEMASLHEDAFRSDAIKDDLQSRSRGHIFVLGFPRSGTTLAGQILGAHPLTSTLDERETLADVAQAYLGRPGGLGEFAALDATALQRWRELYWRRVRESGAEPGDGVFVDKLPMNTLGLPLIARLFPNARVVFMQRDPRDVVLSCFQQRFVLSATTAEFLSLEGAARMFDAVMTLADLYASRLDLAFRRQPLEALLGDFDDQVSALCSFVGLDWTPSMRDFTGEVRAGAIATPSSAQIAKGLNSSGVARWRGYASQLATVSGLLDPWVDRLGYAETQT